MRVKDKIAGKPGCQVDSRAETTRERILAVSALLFAEMGFKETFVRLICERAGVNVASVNYHFGSKEKLYFEVHAMLLRDIMDRLAWLKEEPPPVSGFDEWEKNFADAFMEIMRNCMSGSRYGECRRRLIAAELLRPSKCFPLLQETFGMPIKLYFIKYMRMMGPGLTDLFLDLQVNLLMDQLLGFRILSNLWDMVPIQQGISLDQWISLAVRNMVHMVRCAIEEELAVRHASVSGKAD